MRTMDVVSKVHVGRALSRSGWLGLLFLFLLSLSLSFDARSAINTVVVIGPERSTLAQEIHTALSEELAGLGLESRYLTDASVRPDELAACEACVLVTLGDRALLNVKGASPVISALASSVVVQNRRKAGDNIVRLSTDVVPDKQLWLAQRLLPGVRRLGMLYTEDSRARMQQYEQLAEARGIKVVPQLVSNQETLLPSLNKLLEGSDVIVAMEDDRLYNRDTIKGILLSSYRASRFLIGPNHAFVKAGSLASIYASPVDIAHELTALIERKMHHESLPADVSARRFSVIINEQVARSLGLAVPDAGQLTRQLQRAGEGR